VIRNEPAPDRVDVAGSAPGAAHTGVLRPYAGSDDWEQWQRPLDTNRGPSPRRELEAHTARWTRTVPGRQIDKRKLPGRLEIS